MTRGRGVGEQYTGPRRRGSTRSWTPGTPTSSQPRNAGKGRSVGRTRTVVDVDPDEIFIGRNLDGFDDDPWKDDAQPPGSGAAFGALAAAAAHAAAGGG